MDERSDPGVEELKRRIGALEREVVAMRSSLSWRITAPLRSAKQLARGRRRLPSGFTTTVLNGGLGNQMFQYAAGLQVAHRTGTKLRVDRSILGYAGIRPYELDAFVMPEHVVAKPRVEYGALMDEIAYEEFAAERYGSPVVRERNTGRTDELSTIEGDSVLVGYWQSEDYFPDVKEEIKRLFQLNEFVDSASACASAIEQADVSVAVHVRRGDYVSNPRAAEILGFLGRDYFDAAAEVVRRELGEVEWFVFSDDPAWCRENLDFGGPTTIVSGATTGPEDIRLISLCDHAVISNSSFSWWGAWLGETEASLIVAPDRWTLTPGVYETPGRVPERWQRVTTRLESPEVSTV